jgi:acyl carrier protein
MTDGVTESANGISQQVLDFIRDELLDEDVDVGLEDDLLSGELLYSLAVMRLASWVEETFTIEMTPANLTVENFQTVSALTDFVLREKQGPGAGTRPESSRP